MNKVCLITGGTRGLGKAIAENLASKNSLILIYKSNDEQANLTKKELEEKYNTNVDIFKCDCSIEKDVNLMIEKIISKYKKIDTLINNAGIAKDEYYSSKSAEDFNYVLNNNLTSCFVMSKVISKYMLEQESGKIINISSTNGIDTMYPESMDYDASKAGIISLTKNFANALAPYITVNAVAPGWMNTDMVKDIDLEYKKEEENKILLNRFAEVEEVASLVAFLSSDKCSYINGEVIRVDGGVKC